MPARFFTWIFILLALTLGAVSWWRLQGKNEGKAAETVNVTVPGPTSSILVGHWTLDGNDVVWGDTSTEIKDVSGYAKHGNFSNNLSTGSTTVGRIGQGIVFNGTSDSVSLGSVYNGVKTVAFWVKPNTTTQPFIDLNGTATVDVSSGTVRGNNFTSPTFYKDGDPAMAIVAPVAYRSSSATTYASRTNTMLTAPSGIQNGDLLVIVFDIGAASPPTPTPPSGFTALPNFSSPMAMTASGFTVNMYAWYKFASSESGNYTVTHASASSQGYIAAITGANTTTPFSPNPTKNTGTGTTTTATGLTTPYDTSLVMFISSDWGSTANNLTAPTGSTPTFTKRMGSTTQSGILYVADGVLATAAATGDKTMTNNSAGGEPFGGVLVSIQPVTTPGAMIDTAWHHIAITTATGINASAAYLGLISPSTYFGGMLDDIRFYSTELSATQVADLYRSSGAKQTINFGMEGTLTNGLVGHWTMDGNDVIWGDSSSEVKDRSGSGNHGDAANLTASSAVIGKLGQALSFNGVNQCIDMRGSIFPIQGDSNTNSFAFWVKATVDGRIYSEEEGSAASFAIGGDTGHVSVYLKNSASTVLSSQDSTGIAFDNAWHHVVWTDSNGTAKLYIDGVQDATNFNYTRTGTFSMVYSTIASVNPSCSSNQFTGSLDDFRVYNRVLSLAEVADLYNMGK